MEDGFRREPRHFRVDVLARVKGACARQIKGVPGIHRGKTNRLHHRAHGELMIHKVPDDRGDKQSDPKPHRHQPPAHQDCDPAHWMIPPSGAGLAGALTGAGLAREALSTRTKNSRAIDVTASRWSGPL